MALGEDEAVVRGALRVVEVVAEVAARRTAARSAADIDEVGWPEPALALARTASTRSCCPSSRQTSRSSIVGSPLVVCRNVASDEGRGRIRPPRREAARARARGARRAGPRGRRSRHGFRRRAGRLSGQGARARRGDARRAGRARRARLRLGRRRVGRRVQAGGDPRRDLPRRLLGAPGRRARRHERALPRLGGRRRRARRRARARVPRGAASTAASATWRGCRRSKQWKGASMAETSRSSCTSSRQRGQSVWIDSISREWLRDGRARAADARGRRRRRHLESRRSSRRRSPQGDWYDEQLREVLARARTTRRRSSSGSRSSDIQAPATCCARCGTAAAARTATSRWRSTRRSRTTARRRSSRRCACTSGSTGRTCSSRSRRPKPGLGAIEECIAQGRSINVTLIFSLERYAAVARRTSAGWSGSSRAAATRDRSRRSRASSSRASTPRPTSGSRRSAATRRWLQGKLAIANAKLAYRSYGRRSSRASAGRRSPRRARRRSAASGPRRRRRTPTTATCCTSRS